MDELKVALPMVVALPGAACETQKAVGAVKDAAGKATGGRKLQAKGVAGKASGSAKEAVGKAKTAFKKATK